MKTMIHALNRVLPSLLALTVMSVASHTWAADGAAVYEKVCKKCHRAGVDDAPKLSDKAEWATRFALGKPAMQKSVVEGKGAMNPRAGRDELTDEEISAAIDYIEAQVK